MRAVLSFIAPETCGVSIKVLEDNQGTKALIENPLSSARSKHIAVRFPFIRELCKAYNISVEYVASAEQHADIALGQRVQAASVLARHPRQVDLGLASEGC